MTKTINFRSVFEIEKYLIRYRQEHKYDVIGKLLFLSLDDIRGAEQIDYKFQFEFMKFKNHLNQILKKKDLLLSFKSLLESDIFFNTSLDLVSHIELKHSHLPVDIFTDIISQNTSIPHVIISPRHYFKRGIAGVSNLLHNIYRDLTVFKPFNCAFTTDSKCHNLERNQTLLVYAYATLALQLQDHNDKPQTKPNSKMQILHTYLDNFLYVLQQDFFEVALNNECLTESDRIAFGKINVLRIIVGHLIN